MRQSILEEEEKFREKHVFPILRRATSCFNLSSKQYACTILDEPDMKDAHIAFEHPTFTYKKFVREYAANDF